MVIARLNIGGPATHVVQLAAGLPAERFEVRLIAGREGRGEGSMRYLAEKAGHHPDLDSGTLAGAGPEQCDRLLQDIRA